MANEGVMLWAERSRQQRENVARLQEQEARRLQAQEEAPAEPNFIQSAVGTIGGWLDNMWTDDFSAVPVLGPAAAGVGSGYTAATEGVSMGLSSAALAANPQYWANRGENGDLFADARRVQPGRAGVAAVDALQPYLGVAGTIASPFGAPDIYENDPSFNIANDAQRDRVFSDDIRLQVTSGLMDGLATWFLDPLVIGGKAAKVARFGTTAMGLGNDVGALGKVTSGFTNRVVRDARGINKNVVKAMETEADVALAGGQSPVGVIGERIAAGGFDDLLELPQFQGSSRDLLASAGSAITTREDGIIFAAAAAGSAKYQALLRDRATSLYAGLQRVTRNKYEEMILNTPVGARTPAILPKFLERDFSVESLLDDLAKRDPELKAALEAEGIRTKGVLAAADLVDDAGGLPLIERAGGTSVLGMRVADAWRAGREARNPIFRVKDNALTGVPGAVRRSRDLNRVDGTAPALVEKVFYGASSLTPKVRMLDWVRGYQAAGYIDISGFNLGKSSDELRAALSDSKTIRKDKQFVAEQLRIYGAATTAESRMKAIQKIERNVMQKLADKGTERYGKTVSTEALEAMYKVIDARRAEVVGNFKKQAYGVDPENGDLITASAVLRSQLETNMPMLNLRMMEKSLKILRKHDPDDLGLVRGAGLTSQSALNALDEIQSVWKAAVLLRLGYTIRNTGEGWLRTAAFLGSVPALNALPGGVKNFASNMDRRLGSVRGLKQVIRAEEGAAKQVTVLRESLMEAQKIRADRLAADPVAAVTDIDASIATLSTQIDDIERRLASLAERRKYFKERKGVGDDGAFGGDLNAEYADLYRRLAGAQQTTENFLESAWARGQDAILSQTAWGKITPDKAQYWSQLSSAVRQFRTDEIGRRLLAGDSIGDVVGWLKSANGRSYRREMRVSKEAAEQRVVEIDEMIRLYLPTDDALALARAGLPDENQLRAALGAYVKQPAKPKAPKRADFDTEDLYDAAKTQYKADKAAYDAEMAGRITLSPIHGRQIATMIGGAENIYVKARKETIDRLFYMLGTLPEGALVRHPFYAEVWQRTMNQGMDLARSQGREITPDLLEKMNKTAHRMAMRSTNETLYTVERYSNVAAAMRWFAPFFAAWENSFRVWTRMVVNDPSILARASILWQIPGQLGMVVNEKGEPVEVGGLDFFGGSNDKFIVLPAAVNDVVRKVAGGANIKVPLGSLNVVTPGTTPYLPGFGPTVTLPAGMILAQKPDLQKTLRDTFGDALYEQIAPFGVPQNNPVDAFLPSALRKQYERWRGEDDEAYLRVVGAMWQTAMVDWYKSGANPADKPTADEVMQRANDFYTFSSIASLTLPFATTRTSPYQMQMDFWNNLKADRTMTYEEKVDLFLRTYGDDFAPLMTSTSKTDVPGVDPTIEDYNLLMAHPGLARELTALDPTALGILASSAPVGEFDPGVYKWLNENSTPGMEGPLRGPRGVDEMGTAITMQSAWREYRQMKALRDEAMLALGVKSLSSNAAAGIKAKWDEFTDVTMVQKYGEQWVVQYNSWKDTTAAYLVGIETALGNKTFMQDRGNTPMWNQISQYVDMRRMALEAIAQGADSASVREQFAAWAGEHKNSSLEFSDFYDRFLDQDDLTIGVSELVRG